MTESVNLLALGFDFVPAFEGEIEAVAVIEGAVWAYAIPATPTARVAAPAAMNVLRKVGLLQGVVQVRTGRRTVLDRPPHVNNTSTSERFRF